ncbi:Uncharacterised protein [Mycobacteroides abscessus subsp. massiliense]|nr:Uncharacterised protein [Mycobacteroides abscessus subsp. massiliense]
MDIGGATDLCPFVLGEQGAVIKDAAAVVVDGALVGVQVIREFYEGLAQSIPTGVCLQALQGMGERMPASGRGPLLRRPESA